LKLAEAEEGKKILQLRGEAKNLTRAEYKPTDRSWLRAILPRLIFIYRGRLTDGAVIIIFIAALLVFGFDHGL
jgi:hypothetical protein